MPHYVILNVQFSTENYETFKETSMAHAQKKQKEKKQSIETVAEEVKILDFLDQEFKSAL